jgi:hypothetical protein
MSRTTSYDKIMASFRKPQSRNYRPRFSIKRKKKCTRIFDQGKAIACFYNTFMDIWSFSPFEPDEIANPEPPGKVIDLHTLHNTSLNLGTQGWPAHWLSDRTEGELVKWNWKSKEGKHLEVHINFKGIEDEKCCWVLTVSYDPAWARYRYRIVINARKRDPDGFESLNLMTAGALQARAKNRRWTHSIWENPDGQLRRIVHSNALFFGTDYAGDRNPGGPWRLRNAPYPKSWIGYAAHKSFNPAIMIHTSTVPIVFATCSQLFDEHIVWNKAGQDNLGKDGFFHFHIEAELVNMKARMSSAMLRRAKDPVKPDRWFHQTTVLPFYMDKVNSFDKIVDVWKPEDCPILQIPNDNKEITWVSQCSHSGRRSIRFAGKVGHKRIELYPVGAVCNVKPHTHYRLSGWIRTEKVERFARLELCSYEYTYSNNIYIAHSGHLGGTKDWTQISVELDSDEEAYLMPAMVLYGKGTAWFDDLQLQEIREA